MGELTLLVPRLRSGHFSTELFERYQRSEQALILAMIEMVINGVSTRKVRVIVEELCGTEFYRLTVLELCKSLDVVVRACNERNLGHEEYPFLLVDALVIRVRKDGCTDRQRDQPGGYREILGLKIGDSESEASWSEFFDWLKARGLHRMDMAVSDDHKGVVKGLEPQMKSWRCG